MKYTVSCRFLFDYRYRFYSRRMEGVMKVNLTLTDITLRRSMVMNEFYSLTHPTPQSPCSRCLCITFIRISYMFPVLTDCGNGYEIVTLQDAQFDASSSYAEGPTEADKTQSRIDHMPSIGRINSTEGRGSSLYLSSTF